MGKKLLTVEEENVLSELTQNSCDEEEAVEMIDSGQLGMNSNEAKNIMKKFTEKVLLSLLILGKYMKEYVIYSLEKLYY